MLRFICRPVPLDKQKSISFDLLPSRVGVISASGRTMGFSMAKSRVAYLILLYCIYYDLMVANETCKIAEIKGIIHPKMYTTDFMSIMSGHGTLMSLLIRSHLKCKFAFSLYAFK